MAGEWLPATLGDYIEVKHGFAFDGKYFSDEDNRTVLLTPGNFEIGGGFKGDKLKYYNGPIPEDYILMSGDIIVTMTDLSKQSDTLGFPARVPRKKDYIFLHNQRLGKVIIKSSEIDKSYLYYLLRSNEYREEILASASGTSIKHTAPKRIESFKFLIPPKSEQIEIATILDSLDNKIELNQRMNETLEGIAQALFKSWFVDFDPVQAKADGRKPEGMDDATAALFPSRFTDSPLGLIPEGWTVGTLERVSFLNPESWSRDNTTAQIEYVDLANTKWGTIESTQIISWKDAPSRAQRILRKGDTIVGTVRPGNGSYSFISSDGLTGSTGFAVLRPREDFYREFVYLSTISAENIARLTNLADGAAYPAVRPDVVYATPISFPGDEILLRFSQCLFPIMKKIEINKEENETLREIRNLLLPRLISGKLRVSDPSKEEATS